MPFAKGRRRLFLLSLAGMAALAGLAPGVSLAQIPRRIPIQARLLDSAGQPVNGDMLVAFRLYRVGGSSEPYTETKLITVRNGLLESFIGEGPGGLTPSVDLSQAWELGIQVGSDPEMTPRIPLRSVPYALMAAEIPDDSLSYVKIVEDEKSLSRVSGGAMRGLGGRIGIGTTSPEAPLHVAMGEAGAVSADEQAPLAIESSTNAFLHLMSPTIGERGILFGDPVFNPAGGIVYNGIGTSRGLQFRTGGNRNRMVLDQNGRLGIGLLDPGFPLSFADTLGDKISLWGQSGPHYGLGVQSGVLQVHGDNANSAVAFGHGSSAAFTETMRILGSGNVGIGTSAPASRLHVHSPASSTALNLTSGGSWAGRLEMASNSLLTLHNGGQPRVALIPNGNVGIGTTAPVAKLHVDGDVRVTGDVRKDFGNNAVARMLPVAMGHIASNGSVIHASPNVSSAWISGHYEITIAGLDISALDEYIPMVTVHSGFLQSRAAMFNGTLHVYYSSNTQSGVPAEFSFLLFRP